MAGISVNLLPAEVRVLEKNLKKRSKLFRISAGVVLFMIILTAGIFIFRIIQGQLLTRTNQDLQSAQSQVASLKKQEGLAVYLKLRLSSIEGLKGQPSAQSQAYNLVAALIPSNMNILLLSVDKVKSVELSTQSPDSATLGKFFDNLVNPQVNQGKISKVQVDDLNKNGSSGYKVDLTITLQ